MPWFQNKTPPPQKTASCSQRSGLPRVSYALSGHRPSANTQSSNTSSRQNRTHTQARANHSVLTPNIRPSTQVSRMGVSSSSLPSRGRTMVLPSSIQSSSTVHLQNTTVRTFRNRSITQNSTPTTISHAIARTTQPLRGLSFGIPGSSNINARRTTSSRASNSQASRSRGASGTSGTTSRTAGPLSSKTKKK